ncbi:MAG: NTP transferase domain-containing protein [Rhodobacteraceae bacterium]|nr:NTP transferase domain-containing protein [Paracoccaceae bacterium]
MTGAPGKVFILIPAAGASTRMRGRDKLLEDIDGAALLARQARVALSAGACVGVTYDPAGSPRRMEVLAKLADPRLMTIPVPDAASGMSASLARGTAAAMTLGDGAALTGIMVLPADMPLIDGADIGAVIQAFLRAPGRIARGMGADGSPGHPVIFPRLCFDGLRTLVGDTGARALLQGEDITPVPLPGAHATLDLDTPEAWEAWRAGRG